MSKQKAIVNSVSCRVLESLSLSMHMHVEWSIAHALDEISRFEVIARGGILTLDC